MFFFLKTIKSKKINFIYKNDTYPTFRFTQSTKDNRFSMDVVNQKHNGMIIQLKF